MFHIKPFIVSIWCGFGKPTSLTNYLEPFVLELNNILRNGIPINGFYLRVLIRCFISDSPARAFIKGL